MNEKLLEILENNKEALKVFKDKKTLETILAIKEVFVEKVLERGDMRLLILDSVSRGPKHGYHIMASISKRFHGLYKPSPGAVYPTLQSLEEGGLLEQEDIGGKKTYSLAKKGRAHLKKNKARLEEIFDNFEHCKLGSSRKFSKRMEAVINLWIQMAYEIFFRTREAMRKDDEEVYKKLDEMVPVLEKSLKELKGVWK